MKRTIIKFFYVKNFLFFTRKKKNFFDVILVYSFIYYILYIYNNTYNDSFFIKKTKKILLKVFNDILKNIQFIKDNLMNIVKFFILILFVLISNT